MASKIPDEPPCDTQGTDEESIAFRKKRLRRVSFADREITSVHIFNRDDDYETPPDSTPKPASEREKELVGLFKGLVDSDDLVDEDDDSSSTRKSFLRPIETPSPGGSSTAGSAISNDDDDFFGPVSANFIRPGRLSDSAASDDNHDITMDSTAFSMHFRSLARSESGDLFTSTGIPLASEEKTPLRALSSDTESFMVLREAGKLKSPSSIRSKFSSARDSNDMSLFGESMHRYDYGKLSPTLEALLAEGSEFNNIHASGSTSKKLSMATLSHANDNDCMEPSHFVTSELRDCNDNDMSGKGTSVARNKLVEATCDSTTTLTAQIMRDFSSNSNNGPVAEDFVDHQPPNQLNKLVQFQGENEISEVQFETSALKSESIAVTNCTPVNQSSGAFQLDLVKHFENGNQLPTKDGLKENPPYDNIHTYNVDHAYSQPRRSPLTGSIHSLSAKRQQILLDATNSPRRLLFATPSPKQSGSLLSKGSIKEGSSVASILKSNPELKIPDLSPRASAFNDDAAKSKHGLPEPLSTIACSFNTVLEEMNEGLQSQQETSPTNNNLEKLSGLGLKQGEKDCSGLGTPKNISSLSQDVETTGFAQDKESNEKSIEIMPKITSPSKFVYSGKKVTNHSFKSVDSADATLVASTFNSSSKEITHEFSKDKKDTDIIDKPVSPLVNRLDEKLSSPTGHKGSPSGSLKLYDQDNRVILVSRRDCDPVETVLSSNNLTATAEDISPPSTPVKTLDERESNRFDSHNTFSTSKNFPDRATMKLQSGGAEKNVHTAVERTRSGENFIEEQMKVFSVYTSPASPVSLNCSSNAQRIDDCHHRSNQSPFQDIHNSSKRKRPSEVVIVDVHHSDNNRVQRSPKFHKVGEKNMEDASEYSYGSNIKSERIGGGKILMNWTDISLKLSADINQLLSQCFDRLNLKTINMLEDKLFHQQKVNILELLCSEIQSQLCSQTYNPSCNILHKRVAETRQLLYRTVYGKAKLMLMHVKHERLLKQVELLRTGVQESQMLKLNWVKRHSTSAEKDTKLGDNSSYVTFGDNLKGASGKVSTMKHEVDALEKKIKKLTMSFHACCNIKGEQSSSVTIELVNDHLKKRACCRSIRQDIQSWEIDNLQKRNGHHNVVLNYHGFICQSLKLNTGINSSIFVANKLNDTSIRQNFQNMDACTAFHFVFNHEPTKKYDGPKSLAQETQRTSSLLRNLLDVVEEVQTAKLEIRNMTLTSFHSPSAKQLDLQLAFNDFDSGMKVAVTLDMTCLNCGVYPSDILPYHLQTTGNLQHLALSAEIKAAVGNLRAGYSRIIRLCSCVSQVMQSSGR